MDTLSAVAVGFSLGGKTQSQTRVVGTLHEAYPSFQMGDGSRMASSWLRRSGRELLKNKTKTECLLFVSGLFDNCCFRLLLHPFIHPFYSLPHTHNTTKGDRVLFFPTMYRFIYQTTMYRNSHYMLAIAGLAIGYEYVNKEISHSIFLQANKGVCRLFLYFSFSSQNVHTLRSQLLSQT